MSSLYQNETYTKCLNLINAIQKHLVYSKINSNLAINTAKKLNNIPQNNIPKRSEISFQWHLYVNASRLLFLECKQLSTNALKDISIFIDNAKPEEKELVENINFLIKDMSSQFEIIEELIIYASKLKNFLTKTA